MENYYKLPVAVWENGNVPSVTDTVTCFCIGFGKNINGQKNISCYPLPIPISLFPIIHRFPFFAIYSLLSIIQVLLWGASNTTLSSVI